jgi:hypothetical protein
MDIQRAMIEEQLRAFEEADRNWEAGLEAVGYIYIVYHIYIQFR